MSPVWNPRKKHDGNTTDSGEEAGAIAGTIRELLATEPH